MSSRLLSELPGRQTRANLVKASWPPGHAWVRSGIRLTLSGLIWLAGWPHIASIVAVLAVINLIGTIEAQISKVLFDTGHSLVTVISRAFAKDMVACKGCHGTGELPPTDNDDDNACPDCGGVGKVLS